MFLPDSYPEITIRMWRTARSNSRVTHCLDNRDNLANNVDDVRHAHTELFREWSEALLPPCWITNWLGACSRHDLSSLSTQCPQTSIVAAYLSSSPSIDWNFESHPRQLCNYHCTEKPNRLRSFQKLLRLPRVKIVQDFRVLSRRCRVGGRSRERMVFRR